MRSDEVRRGQAPWGKMCLRGLEARRLPRPFPARHRQGARTAAGVTRHPPPAPEGQATPRYERHDRATGAEEEGTSRLKAQAVAEAGRRQRSSSWPPACHQRCTLAGSRLQRALGLAGWARCIQPTFRKGSAKEAQRPQKPAGGAAGGTECQAGPGYCWHFPAVALEALSPSRRHPANILRQGRMARL